MMHGPTNIKKMFKLSSLFPPDRWQDSIRIRPRPLPSKFFPFHHLPDPGCVPCEPENKVTASFLLGAFGEETDERRRNRTGELGK